MESNRRVGSVLLLVFGRVVAALALSDLNLDCTNDYDKLMCCQLEAHNCTEYSLTLLSNSGYGERQCVLKQNDPGSCRYCCSMEKQLIPGESHTAQVWKGGNIMEIKITDVIESIKPKRPTIVSVNESNGNFEVLWETNMRDHILEYLCAEVTYYKKGDSKKQVIPCFKPATTGQQRLSRYEIGGQDLEPSTTYVVSVRTHISLSNKFSNSSEEKEFTTPASPNSELLAIIISLSLAAVILSGGIYACYVKYKKKWWDAVPKHPNPKLLTMHSSAQEVLKPAPPIISSVCVEPLIPVDSKPWSKMSLTDTSSGSLQQSSGISTGSCLSYANTEPVDIKASVQDALCKALPNISPISQLTTSPILQLSRDVFDVRAPDMNSGSSCFDNKTYSILIPPCPHQITVDSSEVQMQVEILCDSAYHSSVSDMGNCPDRQVPVCPVPAQQHAVFPPVVSSLVPTEMSYQQCNADSGSFSYAEDSSSSSVSTAPSCDVVSGVQVGGESSAEVVSGATKLNGTSEVAVVCDENPCYGCEPAGSRSLPVVDDDYQAFQNLVGQLDVLGSEQRSGEHDQHLEKYQEESFTTFPQSFVSSGVPGLSNDARSGQCVAELQTPFLPLMSAHQSMPIITDSGYQSV